MLNTAQVNIYKAIAEFAYAISKADNYISEEERQMFREMILQEIGERDSIFAEQRFQLIEKKLPKTVEEAYNHALFLVKQNKQALTEEVYEKVLHIAQRVAEVEGVLPEEKQLLERFRKDLISIYFEK